MALSQFQIIQSLGEALSWFEKELSWGVPAAELNHLTGRIGELYTAMFTYGQMATEVNQRGYDVVSADGERISVKTITSSNHVGFNMQTFEHVDRVVVLRINPEELAIEILLDKPANEAKTLMREGADKFIFPVNRTQPRLTRPLEEMVMLREEPYKRHLIRQYENGTIQVLTDGEEVPTTKPVLREIARDIQVDLLNGAGSPRNTRQLGDQIINKLEELRVESGVDA
ncbi:hypothetical protein ACO34A_20570 [Rhizobium sp. ACO-34A]|nr:hypothetical protein [Rhizobium sp. ACO-34A]ATN36187.1 hypothetical protein ACO34A_20570 [Rhizobium sp. ACO-34A]